MSDSSIRIIRVDYRDANQAAHLKQLLNGYARDPLGGGKEIPADALEALPDRLADWSTAFSLICYVADQPAGLANCFFGFSTFAGRPLVNIHDLVVESQFRGRGLSQRLMQAVEEVARDNDCCKLTLEVLNQNTPAMEAYRKFGFAGYELDPTAGAAVFWQKKLV